MSLNPKVLRESLELVIERQPDLTKGFYVLLFERYPEVKPMFSRNAPEQQQKMLTEAIVAVVDHVEDAAWLQETLTALGAKHVEYGVRDEMYGWVGECLLAAMADVAKEAWTPEVEASWVAAYGAISSLALKGAENARRVAS